jgi:hypothetical protein
VAYETADFVIRQGDTAPRLSQELPVDDLTDADVRLHLHGLTVVDDRDLEAEVDDDGSTVFYDWAPEDTELAGYYSAEWQVTFADGKVQTFPSGGVYLVQVVEQVA